VAFEVSFNPILSQYIFPIPVSFSGDISFWTGARPPSLASAH
jgi:hypothetical protein